MNGVFSNVFVVLWFATIVWIAVVAGRHGNGLFVAWCAFMAFMVLRARVL